MEKKAIKSAHNKWYKRSESQHWISQPYRTSGTKNPHTPKTKQRTVCSL